MTGADIHERSRRWPARIAPRSHSCGGAGTTEGLDRDSGVGLEKEDYSSGVGVRDTTRCIDASLQVKLAWLGCPRATYSSPGPAARSVTNSTCQLFYRNTGEPGLRHARRVEMWCVAEPVRQSKCRVFLQNSSVPSEPRLNRFTHRTGTLGLSQGPGLRCDSWPVCHDVGHLEINA